MLCNFSVRMLKYYLKNLNLFFCPQKVEKTTPKSCILMAARSFFFSAAPTARNSPELHFRFINSFIQPSLVGSLLAPQEGSELIMVKPQNIIHFNSNPFIFLQAKELVEAKAGKLPLDGQWYWDKKLFYIVEMRVLTPWDVLLLMFVQMMPKN